MEQDNHTTAAEVALDHDGHAGLLQDLLTRIAPRFARRETRLTCGDMVRGLLTELGDHNCWSIAEAVGHPGPSLLQHLLSRASCDEQQILQESAGWAIEHLAVGRDDGDDGDAVLIVVETSDLKSSTEAGIRCPGERDDRGSQAAARGAASQSGKAARCV